MSFQDDYIDILKYAKQKRYLKGLTTILPEDLVNEAYINLYEKPYSKELFLKEINNLSLIEKHNVPKDISWGEAGVTYKFRGESTCIKCKQVKTSHEFKINKTKFGRQFLRSICIECENKIQLARYHKRKLDPNFNSVIYAEANKKIFKKYVKNNRVKWNTYLRGRAKKEKENLTDAYIRKLIRNRYKEAKVLLNSPAFVYSFKQMIVEKRISKLKKIA